MSTKKAPKRTSAKKLCSSVIVKEGLKKDGTLKKGYHYAAGGKIVKAKPVKKVVAKKEGKPEFSQSKIDSIAGKLLNEGLTASSFTIAKAKAKTKNTVLPLYVEKMISAYSKEIKAAMKKMKK